MKRVLSRKIDMILYCFIWKDVPKKDLQSPPYSLRTVRYHILSYEKDSIESPFIENGRGSVIPD